jgi:hypothetical protein
MSNARDLAVGGHRLIAWVAFDGTNANLANNSQTGLYQSHGVSGITDVSDGEYIVHFSPALDDTDYLVIANAYGFNESRTAGRIVSFARTSSAKYNDSKETTHCRIDVINSTSSGLDQYIDAKNIFVLIFK